VTNGTDPRAILAAAPKSPISSADMGKAMTAAAQMKPEDKAALAAAMGVGAGTLSDEQYAINYGAGGASKSSSKKSSSSFDDLMPLADPLATDQAPVAMANSEVSPEITAALARQEQEARLANIHNQTIFQMVHAKYKEKYLMIYGANTNSAPGGAGGALTGIADANGN
jgi:hypothetical protein